MDSRKGFYLRVPEDVRAELEQAHWDTRLNRDEILLQGFAIWLHAQRSGSLEKVLGKVGYQPKHHPGRVAAAVNGQASPAPYPEPPKDDWSLE